MPSESKPAVVNVIDVVVKLAIPVILGFAGHWVSLAIEKSQSAAKMVELAIEIKRVEQIDPRIDEWAESVLGRYSGVEFPASSPAHSTPVDSDEGSDERGDESGDGDEDHDDLEGDTVRPDVELTHDMVPLLKSASPRILLREDQLRVEAMRYQLAQLIETNEEGADKLREWVMFDTRYGQQPLAWIGQASEDELTQAFRVVGIPTYSINAQQRLPANQGSGDGRP